MSVPLVVPIRVEALPIGTQDGVRGIGPYADFGAVAGRYAPYVGAQVVNRLFSGGRPLEPGVHVHWHLPRALLRAPVTTRQPAPPPAPDRWLVVRFADSRTEAWVVESNYLHEEPLYSETTYPGGAQAGERPFSYLGRVYALADWPGDEGSYLEGLTGFGYGIPGFAGCYGNCRNVFGLHDRAPGDGPLSYAVVGWHHDPACDPLRAAPTRSRSSAGSSPRTHRHPERTLYFGAVRGLPFDPEAEHLAQQTSPLSPAVAIGNTPAEALAALAAGPSPTRPPTGPCSACSPRFRSGPCAGSAASRASRSRSTRPGSPRSTPAARGSCTRPRAIRSARSQTTSRAT